MKTSEVLNRAADLIEERGWGQGPRAFGDKGGSLCLEGGIIAALGYAGWRAIEPDEFWDCPAYHAVGRYLGVDFAARDEDDLPAEPLWRWNDRDERTAEEVVSTLRAAALIEAVRETEVRILGDHEHHVPTPDSPVAFGAAS